MFWVFRFCNDNCRFRYRYPSYFGIIVWNVFGFDIQHQYVSYHTPVSRAIDQPWHVYSACTYLILRTRYQVVQNWRPVFHDCPAFDTYHNYEANMYPGWQWTPNAVEHVVELEEDRCSIATWNRRTREQRRRKRWSRTGMLLDEHSQHQNAETARSKCTPSLYKKVILNKKQFQTRAGHVVPLLFNTSLWSLA